MNQRRGSSFELCLVLAYAAACSSGPSDGRIQVHVTLSNNFDLQKVSGLKLVLDGAGGTNLSFAATVEQNQTAGSLRFTSQVTDDDGDPGTEFVVTFAAVNPFAGREFRFNFFANTGAATAFGIRCSVISPGGAIDIARAETTTTGAPITAEKGKSVEVSCLVGCTPGVTCTSASTGPIATGTSPASPANNNSPRIVGTTPQGSTVYVYTNAGCTTLAASGSAETFVDGGILVSVADNSSTTFFVGAADDAGNRWNCSDAGITYVEDSTAPTLVLARTLPESPSHWRYPRVFGTVSESATIQVFGSSGCDGGVIGSGLSTELVDAGIVATVAENATTTLSAHATDVAGQVSSCAALGQAYVHSTALGGTSLAVGSDFACALSSGGGVKCWGYNDGGQVGTWDAGIDGGASPPLFLAPTSVPNVSSGVSAVSAGNLHACAIRADGGLACWGNNVLGAIGVGAAFTGLTPPTNVQGLGDAVKGAELGSHFSTVVLADGGAKWWGYNYYLALDSPTPVELPGLADDGGIAMISAGVFNACALLKTGIVKCWGFNYFGQVGDGTTEDRFAPVTVSGMPSPIIWVAVGGSSACAVDIGGAAWCWGNNTSGLLGDGTMTARPSPTRVSALDGGVRSIALAPGYGVNHGCATLTSGALKCWGENGSGQLGVPDASLATTPTAVIGIPGSVEYVAVGDYFACARLVDAGVVCWGLNSSGQLGNGTTDGGATPTAVISL